MGMLTRAGRRVRPLFTAMTAARPGGGATGRLLRAGERDLRGGVAVDIIATFVGVLERLDAGRAANQSGEV